LEGRFRRYANLAALLSGWADRTTIPPLLLAPGSSNAKGRRTYSRPPSPDLSPSRKSWWASTIATAWVRPAGDLRAHHFSRVFSSALQTPEAAYALFACHTIATLDAVYFLGTPLELVEATCKQTGRVASCTL